MIDIIKCKECGHEGIDMAFYVPGKPVYICPRCKSGNVEVLKK